MRALNAASLGVARVFRRTWVALALLAGGVGVGAAVLAAQHSRAAANAPPVKRVEVDISEPTPSPEPAAHTATDRCLYCGMG